MKQAAILTGEDTLVPQKHLFWPIIQLLKGVLLCCLPLEGAIIDCKLSTVTDGLINASS